MRIYLFLRLFEAMNLYVLTTAYVKAFENTLKTLYGAI